MRRRHPKLDRWRKALHGGGVVARNMATGGAIVMSSPQAHELIDQLAIQLHRPDLVVAHQFRPQRRDQPGMQPQPRKPS